MKRMFTMILVAVSLATVSAAVITVPEDAATIQAGIDIAVEGDTVKVHPGTYVENINFNGKDIVVRSNGGAERTIIDGNQNGSAVLMINGESQAAVLEGFTITNGTGWFDPDEEQRVGGGIACRDSSSPTLKRLIITGNTAIGANDPSGGGITLAYGANAILEDIVISNNVSKWGGGLTIVASNPYLKNVEILSNEATTTGGGVYIGVDAAPVFCAVTIQNNRATYYGGGLFIHDHSKPVMNTVTVRDNRAPSGGAGMIVNHGSKPLVINSIFWGNFPDQIMFNNDAQYLPDTVSIAYSDIMNGESGVDTGPGLLNWLTGNIEADPLFEQDGSLSEASPCIDAGTSFFLLDGDTVLNMTETEYCGSNPDMGACEKLPPPLVYNVPGSFSTIQGAIDLSKDGDTVQVDVGTYYENINFNGKNVIVRSVGGPELTIIDGSSNGSTVSIVSEERSAVLEGFTITNGSGTPGDYGQHYGGGIYIKNAASPHLRNLIIENNTTLGDTAMGGGIFSSSYTMPLLENIVIRNNEADYCGGFVAFYCDPIIRGMEVYSNYARTTGGGIAFWGTGEADVQDLTVYSNRAYYMAGGIVVYEGAKPILNNVTVTKNRCTVSTPSLRSAGGMVVGDGSIPTLINSIFWGNSPNEIEYYWEQSANHINIFYSCVAGGLAGIETNNNGTVNWDESSISLDPLFTDVIRDDFTPRDGSPVIDAGIAFFEFGDQVIVDMNEDEYVGVDPDMGSVEVQAPPITLLVPLHYSSIQQAIGIARDGDTVLVGNGTYNENINFMGKNITVRSVTGPAGTIIDGTGDGSTVSIVSGEESAILDGFTITGGNGTPNVNGHRVGGGIAVRYESTPTLRNLIVENNIATGDTAMGGGIMCSYGSDAIFEDIIIRNNESEYGGGFLVYEANPVLSRIEIHENHARVTGGGLAFWNSQTSADSLVIHHNTARYLAAGIWLHDGADVVLDQVTVVDNECTYLNPSSIGGGGMELSTGSSVVLKNSILWNNYPNEIEFYGETATNSAIIMYSDIGGGAEGIETNSNGAIQWAQSNIDMNPMFCNPDSSQYTLAEDSPCVGTGLGGVNMGALEIGCTAVGINPDLVGLPSEFRLYQNYPNPFNPSTTITYDLPGAGWVKLVIYDVRGRELRVLVEDEQVGGYHTFQWSARNHQGKALSAGVYLYEMTFTDKQGKDYRSVKKFSLIK